MNISATNRRKYSENYGVHIEEGATVSAVQALDPAKSQAGGEELRVWFSVTRGGGGHTADLLYLLWLQKSINVRVIKMYIFLISVNVIKH